MSGDAGCRRAFLLGQALVLQTGRGGPVAARVGLADLLRDTGRPAGPLPLGWVRRGSAWCGSPRTAPGSPVRRAVAGRWAAVRVVPGRVGWCLGQGGNPFSGDVNGMRTWEDPRVKNQPVRTLAVAVLLATSAGAQVMAGVDGPMTVRVAGWLAGTVLAAGAAGMLTGSSSDQKTHRAARLQRFQSTRCFKKTTNCLLHRPGRQALGPRGRDRRLRQIAEAA